MNKWKKNVYTFINLNLTWSLQDSQGWFSVFEGSIGKRFLNLWAS